MANRYCNLVGSKKISEDFQNINVGFDKVQQDMDSKSSGNHRHPNATDTTDGFMSAQDKAKMDASTASATPGTLVQRDASGRLKAAAPSAKTDVARKAEVDTVQADLDAHKADAVVHVTAEDHEKLGSIEEGAEVNQPAFAKVNDIEASEKTDALTFKGGVGIKITTNPNTKEVTVTATGDSTPGAHGSSHTEHGSDPIPNATAKEGGLMSAEDKAELEQIATEVPKQAAELKEHDKQLQEHAAELEDHEQRIDGMETGLADAPDKPLELRPGLQIVESEQDTPFRMGEVKGRTLVNLLGRDGNFDYRTSPLFTFFGTGEIIPASTPVGTKVQKIVCNRTDTAHFGARYELDIDRSKHYVAVAYLDNISCDEPVYFSFAEWKSTGYYTIRKSGNVKKGEGMQYRYIDISPDRLETQEKLVFYFRGEGTAGAEFRIGAFGLYEISQSEYEAIGKMKFAQVAERYPYVDSMTNVTNPYAIVTGGNLLPPFYDGWAYNVDNGSTFTATGPYTLTLEAKANNQQAYYDTPVVPNTTYSIGLGQGKYAVVGASAGNPVIVDWTAEAKTFNTGTETKVRVYLGNYQDGAGAFTFKNPILTIGSEPKPFTPQQRSTLAFETELAAHPIDGSNPDTLFMGDDGLPYVLENWGKITLTPNIFDDAVAHRHSNDYKQITLVLRKRDTTTLDATLAKFDGKLLSQDVVSDPLPKPDVFNVGQNEATGYIWLTIANTDSGWGPDYVPTQDEIRAYFLGWKMYDNIHPDNPHNGAGKAWIKITCRGTDGRWSSAPPDARLTTPVDPAGIDSNGRVYTPYRLQYLKAKPTVEPVRNYELGATLSTGSNMVEVGSGIVIRERANPVYGGAGYYYINTLSSIGNPFKHRTNKINMIYAGHNEAKSKWIVDGVDAYGNERAKCLPENFDPNAVYHVTYTMLDPTLAAPISGTVAANLRGTVSDLVQDVGDVQRRLSVVEMQKAEKDKASPQWIQATLLNGWRNLGGTNATVSYFKDSLGFVHIRGTATAGSGEVSVVLFRLPVGYRPSAAYRSPVINYTGAGISMADIAIVPSGDVVIETASVSNNWLDLHLGPFLAEQ
ncbi:hypothetical protein J27TS7_08660 [Paenibacillus dendritiformis]|uniref:hypothetical protein n=1 Tax=Paenibacillus dendritiformis TaxID=130049 RepID=UPI001B2BEED4|nr:hypothetical protein [Paenibacillus dendritiformis]GIO71352.1 hypothetical protein J27TS7_08660 [Paenibacillus dendritiformis]